MSSVIVAGDTSGSVTLQAPAVAGTTVLTLPTTSGTVVVNNGAQTIEFADGSASAPSITNSGDTNTGIFFPAADTIAFTEGGTESMRIDSSGFLLVNLTSNFNNAKIQAKDIGTGCYGWTDSTSVVDARLFAATGQGAVLATQSAHPISLQTNAVERMRITSAGNVGIGTASPANSLTVYNAGANTTTSIALDTDLIAGLTVRKIGLTSAGGTVDSSVDFAFVDRSISNESYIAFRTTLNNATRNLERMRVTSSGTLFVGYTSGNSVTYIETPSISIGQTGTSSTTAKIRFAPAQSGYTVMGIYNSQSASGGGLVFTTADSSTNSSNTKLMTLDSSGNLNFNVAGANINTTPTSLPSSTSIGYSIITSLGEITFVENVTNVTLSSVSIPPGVWQITFVAQLIDAFGTLNATACACAITTDSAYAFPISTNANFRPDHNIMYTAGAPINTSSYRGRVMHTRTVTNTTGSNVTYYIRIGTNGTSSGTYGLKGELNAIKVY